MPNCLMPNGSLEYLFGKVGLYFLVLEYGFKKIPRRIDEDDGGWRMEDDEGWRMDD